MACVSRTTEPSSTFTTDRAPYMIFEPSGDHETLGTQSAAGSDTRSLRSAMSLASILATIAGSEPSAANVYSATSSPSKVATAIRSPSGDHDGALTAFETILFRSDPSGPTVYTSTLAPPVEASQYWKRLSGLVAYARNAMLPPSGDQAGGIGTTG